MSIVEKALKKLQTGVPSRSETPAVVPSNTASVRVSTTLTDHTSASGVHRRVPIGNADKIVTVDRERLRRDGMLPPPHQERELSHQYRTLKRPLIKQAFESPKPTAPGSASLRSVMVSSALPGEGKTFTSLNLAMSLALEKDHSVLLVDGDIPKPHVTQTFGLQNEPGLLDLIIDPSIPVESLVLPTDVPNLSILPVGHRAEAAPELLASARMRQIIARLEQLDPLGMVVVDSPPILLTSEARVLASLFGQVVLVVHAGGTQQRAVLEAIEILGDGPRIGLVLNQAAHENSTGTYYGDYYGQYYDSGADKSKDGARRLEGSADSDD